MTEPLDPVLVVRALETMRLPLTSEGALQAAMAEALAERGMPFVREHRLSSGDIVDLFLDGVGVEVKIGGSKRGIYRQVRRYVAFDEIRALVVATNVMVGLPLFDKPVCLVNLGRAWL